MELDKVLNFIKDDFPDKSIDISESLELLKETIDDIIDKLSLKTREAYKTRNFSLIEKYKEIGMAIDDYENKIENIIDFTAIEQVDISQDDTAEIKLKNSPDYQKYLVDNKAEHTLYENFTHIRPFGFKFNTTLIEVKTWQEMFLKTCEILLNKDEKKFLQFQDKVYMNGKKNKYFSTSEEVLRKPVNISGEIYVETNLSSNSIRNIIVKMLKEYNIKINDFKIYFRADYTTVNSKADDNEIDTNGN